MVGISGGVESINIGDVWVLSAYGCVVSFTSGRVRVMGIRV